MPARLKTAGSFAFTRQKDRRIKILRVAKLYITVVQQLGGTKVTHLVSYRERDYQ